MRELAKSMLSFSWAMSVFGLNQMANILSPQTAGRSAAALDAVSRATEGQLGPLARQTFRTGDNLQRQVTDSLFSLLSAGGDPLRAPLRVSAAAGDRAPGTPAGGAAQQVLDLGIGLLQQGIDVAYRMMGGGLGQPAGQSGWGPVPPPPQA
jgi:hypothetical protein